MSEQKLLLKENFLFGYRITTLENLLNTSIQQVFNPYSAKLLHVLLDRYSLWNLFEKDLLVSAVSSENIDVVSPSVFRCTSTPMETGPIDACVETYISPDLTE